MRLFTVVAFLVLPFIVGAVPVSPNPSPTGRPISIPLTKRSNHLREDGTIDSDKLDAGIGHTARRYKRALDLYERNTGKSHPLASKRGQSNERRSEASIPLANHSNVEWIGLLTIGNPPKLFNLQLDTLFSDTFVASKECTTCENQNLYDISSSTTAEDENQTISSNFDATAVTGEIVTDDIGLDNTFQVRQTFVAATSTNLASQNLPFIPDGVLGLGLSASSVLNKSESFFGNLFLQSNELQGAEPVFGLVLSDEVGAEFIVGGTDTSKFMGGLTFVKMDTLDFWQIPMDSMTIDGTTVTTTTTDTAFDSAGLQITADAATITNIYNNIPGSAPLSGNSQQYTIPCDTASTITISYGGTPITIPPSSYVLGPVSAGSTSCMGGFAVTSSDLDMGVIHMGTVLMENLYTQFDIENLQIGLAQVVIPVREP